MSWLGDYTATSSYSITCNEDLAALAVAVNNNTRLYNFTGKTVTVTNNSLDLSAHYWTPIGNTTENDPSTRIFQGTFGGSNHIISSMNVTKVVGSNNIYAGLFGSVKGATIKNVALTDVVVNVTTSNGNIHAGGLVGWANGSSITNCYATGNVSASGSCDTALSCDLTLHAKWTPAGAAPQATPAATAKAMEKATTAPVSTQTQTVSATASSTTTVTTVITTGVAPTLTQASALVAGLLFGVLAGLFVAAVVLQRHRE